MLLRGGTRGYRSTVRGNVVINSTVQRRWVTAKRFRPASPAVALENHQYDWPMDLPPKPEILSEIHYRVPYRSSAMTKTKDCFQTQTRRQVFSAGKQCEWSDLHTWSEPLRATIPVQNGARLSCDPWINVARCMRPPSHCMDAERLNLLKNDRSGNGSGPELSERREKHHFFPSKRNKRADMTHSRRDNKFSSHASGNTKPGWTSSFSPSSCNWRSRRHDCRRPISFNGGRDGRFLAEQNVDVCFVLRSNRFVHVIFV